MTTRKRQVAFALAIVLAAAAFAADEPQAPVRTLYVTATAHLDTQWRWTIRDTIEKFIPDTLHGNFALFEKYPDYVFSFEGAFRYMLMKEYYPAEYGRLTDPKIGYVKAGRWKPAGSWVDAVDTNIPSPESLFRQALYGNGFFAREFGAGARSRDVYLPDCFGFGFALPSIAAHSGLVGFSTQKLTWGSSVGVPFDVGLWEGVDGSRLVAVLNPGDYVSKITSNLATDPTIVTAIDRVGGRSGAYVNMKYFGVGDQGGAPRDASVELLEQSLHTSGPVTVRSAASDQLARDLTQSGDAAAPRNLPTYRGELLMTSHGAGCYTSEAAMKRFNRSNERLADAAERAAVVADWLGGLRYPTDALRDAWVRFLWHQFHDDLTGTSLPEAYEFSWNDEAIAANQFAGILSDAVGVVARAVDTRTKGVPLVVYNPLSLARTDIVEADVTFDAPPAGVRVLAPDGREVAAQMVRAEGKTAHVLFVASAPSLSFTVFDVQPLTAPVKAESELSVSALRLENARYRVELGPTGDIAAIHDKAANLELLSAPLQLQLLHDMPSKWPAWEVDFADLSATPRTVVGGEAKVRVVESGPARVALEVTRTADGSTFVQTLRLAAGGAGDRIEIVTEIDWRTPGTLLKAAFPLASANESATYDLGLGTIARGVSTPRLYEVPAQRWADLSAKDGHFGVAILNDSKYGWDHPDAGTLRLTLLHTPAVRESWRWVGDQLSMDLGHHRVLLGLVGHAGDWREGGVPWHADRLNQPLLAWQSTSHAGALGRVFSLAQVETGNAASPPVAIRALKKAEEGAELVVRMEELTGRAAEAIRLKTASPIVGFREINAAEEPLVKSDPRIQAPAHLDHGVLVVPFAPYQPRTFALKLAAPPAQVPPPQSKPLRLPFDLDGVTRDGETGGDFDGEKHTIAAELFPSSLQLAGATFSFGPKDRGDMNVLRCRGQQLELPKGLWNRLYLLATALGDREAVFEIGGVKVPLWIQDWAEPIAQWDNRLNGGVRHDDPAEIVPAYTKTARLGWLGTHRHDRDGRNQAYAFTNVFFYRLDLPRGVAVVTLPNDPAVRILAATVARSDNDAVVAAQRFFDPPQRTAVRIRAPHTSFTDSLRVEVSSPNPYAVVHYTLDGSEPSAGSPIVAGPLTLTATTTVKARAFAPGLDNSFTAAATFRQLTLHPAVTAPDAKPGLACRYYEGQWRELPDVAALKPARDTTLAEVLAPAFTRPEYFVLTLSGYWRVPSDGLYLLSLRSDDVAALDLDGDRLIDPASANGGGDDRRELALKAGLHPLSLRYLHRRGDAALELWIQGPGFAMRPIRQDELLHDPDTPGAIEAPH
jgi:alpha-mannosidase